MDEQLRNEFDTELERVLRELPAPVQELLEQVSLIVEDYPSRDLMRQMGIARRDDLCGLYVGIPLPERSIEHSGILSDVVYLFRQGIMAMARGASGTLDTLELNRQIRITVL
ncbi:MAG: metallopeptidase family protein, partial [Gammaproteobacteria bacterium]|nr:metallopeptidase family protein [Gammaproteobacteria bacterium]